MAGTVTIFRPDGSQFSFDGEEMLGFAPSATITNLPVEDGSTVSDNAVLNNEPIRIRAHVTNTPFLLPGLVGGQQRTMDAVNNLRGILGVPVTIVIDSKVVSSVHLNCILAEMPHEVRLLEELVFDCRFVKVGIAEAQLVLIPPEQPPPPTPEKPNDKGLSMPDETDVGEQPPTKELPPEKAVEDDRSYLAKALDGDLI